MSMTAPGKSNSLFVQASSKAANILVPFDSEARRRRPTARGPGRAAGESRAGAVQQQFPLRGRHSRKARRGSIVAKEPAAATHLARFGLAPTLS